MNTSFTKVQRQAYLKNPHYCPVCGHPNVEVLKWDSEIQSQDVQCSSGECGFIWREIFKMIDIEPRWGLLEL